ncbi:MAG TPA: LysR substrate-binding domain-containing protein [Reyranella sp.]|jgi:LysR family cys regulon transcriptional activator
MNLQQLRYLCEIAQRGLNISLAAKALNTSQSGVSKQIKRLEQELGFDIFERSRNRIAGITPSGQKVVALAQEAIGRLNDILSVSSETESEDSGSLTVAISHTQARYVLPETLGLFTKRYPNVTLTLRHANPRQIAEMLLAGEADLGVTTESDRSIRSLAFLACRRFERVLVVPEGHPLLAVNKITLADIAQYPLVAYEQAFTGRRLVERAFEQAGLSPKVALSAIDADVIKACVERGLGVAILSEVTFDPARDAGLRAIPLGLLVAPSITSIAVRHRRLRGYEYDFISMCSADWTRARVDRVLSGPRTR